MRVAGTAAQREGVEAEQDNEQDRALGDATQQLSRLEQRSRPGGAADGA